MYTVLIIDDETKLRSLLARIVALEGFEVHEAPDFKSGLKKLEQYRIDAVLCDVRLPDMHGVEGVKQITAQFPLTEVILMTAYGTIPDGVQAIRNGAFDYITKGDDNNKILPLIHRAVEKSSLRRRVCELEQQVGKNYTFDSITGTSPQILQAVELGKKVAATTASVLLTGETGTGKEVFAQAIHQASERAGKSFVALNCSAFSKELMEGELFGHKQGAFTGALKDQKGLMAEANGGTLFLDEIGEMPLELQAKLLRVLETSEYVRIGDTKPSKSEFRLIAATNRDLKTEADEHRFRPDLYFRLNVFQIELPALRDRLADIPLLAAHFAGQFALKMNKKTPAIAPEFLQLLIRHSWQGNIRELKNIIERAVILCSNEELSVSTLPYEMQQSALSSNKPLSAFSMSGMEKEHIRKVLQHTNGNKAEAARLLEIGIATLYRKIEEYQLGN